MTISRHLAAGAAAVVALFATSSALAARPAHLISFGGFGTTEGVVIRGRAFKGKPSSDGRGRGWARKAASTIHAFLRDDLENVEVKASEPATRQSWLARTDDEGFYEILVPGPVSAGLHRYRVQIGKSRYAGPPVEVKVQVVPARSPGLVVITDIDDTIVATGVTDPKHDLLARVATSNADDMRPFEGAAATLHAFHAAGVPVAYISAGPVELAHRTARFLALRGFPPGPIFLRHYEDDGFGKPIAFKQRRIQRVLAAYPSARLVLFGDNGEADPEIYAAVAKESGRVAAVYIRAQRPATGTDPRYAGMNVFTDWLEVRRLVDRAGLLAVPAPTATATQPGGSSSPARPAPASAVPAPAPAVPAPASAPTLPPTGP